MLKAHAAPLTRRRELVAYATLSRSLACGSHLVRKSAGMLGSSTLNTWHSAERMRCWRTVYRRRKCLARAAEVASCATRLQAVGEVVREDGRGAVERRAEGPEDLARVGYALARLG